MKPINSEIMMQYGLNINKVNYNRSNYYLETTKGLFMLRKVMIPQEQIAFEYEVNKQLIDKGFNELEKLYLTQRNNPYVLYQDKAYVLQSFEKANEIDFKEVADLKAIVGVLARFHKAACSIETKGRDSGTSGLKNVYEHFNKRRIETRKLKKSISKLSQKSPFEIKFIEGYSAYEDLQLRALSLIDYDLCENLVNQARTNKTIIHNDYTYHAVTKGEKGTYKINNLDQCTYNIQIMDLANVLIKVMQKNTWEIELLSTLLNEYSKERSLSSDEMQVLKAMLIFPEKYANICNKYLNSKRRNHYSMFELKWENMSAYQEEQMKAAENIEKYL